MRLEGVGRRYGLGGHWVLRDVDLEVPPGALLRVQGANGSGKSTLLRIVAGVDRPSTGRITGRPATAYVPERFPPALPFDAHGYLVHLGAIHGLRRTTAARRAAEWLERFGAAGHARTPMDELSKGTAQKIAVVQALLAEPRLLVLDEAWTGLDEAARAVLDDAVRERVAAGGAVVFVDHDARRLAGEPTGVHRFADGRLTAVAESVAESGAEADVPRVVVEASGPGEPPALPGTPGYGPAGPGRIRITAPAQESDAVLRALLTADPPWHIQAVRPAQGPGAAGPEAGPGSGAGSADTRGDAR
ncbi:ATP-binding cassette domain-containing protein [Streptomyces fildesensis]|uniref:ATP-binding cassette domain-containing protein n=1 Tax=Streptomyces fildesensis TaxID=375757 RepID=A0ABW8CA20_9ACTN